MDSLELATRAVQKGALQKVTELDPLIRLLKRRKLRRVVEIGTAAGGTFYLWCRLAEPDALLVSIDLPGGLFGGILAPDDPRVFLRYRKRHQSLHFLRQDSHQPATKKALQRLLPRQRIDLLMIDGDHTYEGVKKDWEQYSPLVRRNGLILFHDVSTAVQGYGVRRFWGEIKSRFRHLELIDGQDDSGWGSWGGIGVVFYGVAP